MKPSGSFLNSMPESRKLWVICWSDGQNIDISFIPIATARLRGLGQWEAVLSLAPVVGFVTFFSRCLPALWHVSCCWPMPSKSLCFDVFRVMPLFKESPAFP